MTCLGKGGRIDSAGFRVLWDDYFYSTDKAKPGNHLFGKITTK